MLTFFIIFILCVVYYSYKKYYSPNKVKGLYVKVSSLAGEEINIPIENAPQAETINVKIKDNSVDLSRIIEYTGELPRKFEFRPETFEQFIGQEEAKDRAETIIKKAKMNLKSHFLVDGIRGHGKTTYVHLIQKELGCKLIEYIGRQINEDNIVDIINKINTSKEQYVMFFVDEFDSMDTKVIKILNPIIETFELSGKKIKPFIFAGATINKHELIKGNPDTLDRISFQVKFKKYNADELMMILKQYHDQLYQDIEVSHDILYTIATSCKFNPRTAIGLLEEYVVEKNINKVLKNNNILLDGLTVIDIKILEALSKVKRMGANSLAMRVGLGEREYVTEFEPFLVEYGYINRIPNRVIADKGLEILKSIKDKI
jgi:Holliday junction resolvasome RuvABC ATP-dependent DNA helicase subunit